MMQQKVIQFLSDGKFHSGEEIGSQLDITRSAIWKIIKQLQAIGIEINSIRGKGYQIPNGIELLNKKELLRHLSKQTKPNVPFIEIINSVNSTNQYLLDRIKSYPKKKALVLAEHQLEGRGRRGRAWHSPFGVNIYMSLLWEFSKDPGELTGLGLVVGLAIVRALKKYGIENLKLKWPNDILYQGKKLAGILIESISESYSNTTLVIGMGINIAMSSTQNWISVSDIFKKKPERNKIASYIIDELLASLLEFEQHGFTHFIPEWQVYDALINQTVAIHQTHHKFNALVKGINNRGELIVLTESGEIKNLLHGDVSVRNF